MTRAYDSRFSNHELSVINAIVSRARFHFPDREARDIKLDIMATHLATPLRLDDLLDADDFDFVHDILGIEHHLDHELLVLRRGFIPRYAQQKA